MPSHTTEIKPEFGDRVWQLPPLILHPFADRRGPAKLIEGSRASLILAGLLKSDAYAAEDLARKLLESRYCEIRMLYYVGKDLTRWSEQCAEFTAGIADLAGAGIRAHSFSTLLVENAPEPVKRKLQSWGVSDPSAVFSRALALNAIFREAPLVEQLSESFIRHYHRFADHLFACARQLAPFTEILPANFAFELYASAEYSRILEAEWAASDRDS
jgi:hypothetical protein